MLFQTRCHLLLVSHTRPGSLQGDEIKRLCCTHQITVTFVRRMLVDFVLDQAYSLDGPSEA